MTRNNTLLAALPALAVLGLATPAPAATIATQQATIVSSNGYVNSDTTNGGNIGRNGGNNANFRSFGLFNVQDLLTTEGLTFADLSTFTFDFAFTTEAGTTLSAGSYKVGYAGFFANSVFTTAAGQFGAGGSAWGDVPYGAADDIDTGIADLAGAQTISQPGFSLSSLTNDGDLSNDFVVFGISYDEPQAAGVFQNITNGSMTLTAVPEPGSLALLGLGGLLIARRRRG